MPGVRASRDSYLLYNTGMSANYTFKQHAVSPPERLWLEEAAKPDFSARAATIRLHANLPRDFYPEQIDPRLYALDRVTPVGLWHLDPNHPRLKAMGRTVQDVRDRILNDNTATSISVADIARTTGLAEREVSNSLLALADNGSFYDEAKMSVVDGLNAIPGIECRRPAGAFYVFPDISATGLTGAQLADRLLNESGVSVLAGTAFGEQGVHNVRISYANSQARISEALGRIRTLVEPLVAARA